MLPKACLVAAFVFFLHVAFSSAGGCKNPQLVESSGHSTVDGFFFYRTTIVVQFTIKCDRPAKIYPLYAEIDGQVMYAAQSEERDTYQVSWSIRHKEAYGRRFEIRIYDDEGYAELKKALRGGEKAKGVKPLFTISYNHKGLTRGPILSTETVVLLLIIAVYSFAYRWKSFL